MRYLSDLMVWQYSTIPTFQHEMLQYFYMPTFQHFKFQLQVWHEMDNILNNCCLPLFTVVYGCSSNIYLYVDVEYTDQEYFLDWVINLKDGHFMF